MTLAEVPTRASDNQITVSRERVDRLLDIFASITAGDYDHSISVDERQEDDFTPVEISMNFMIEQLLYEREQNETNQAALEKNLDTIIKQREAIEELSTPIIKIWDKVLVLPLIGTLDTRRSQKLTESLLTEIASTLTRVAILDITGVPTVDSAVANHLLKAVAAVGLLGAHCVITGIRPEVAQTIVHLGVDLSGVETLSDLSEGLKWAFKSLDYRISKSMAR